MKPSVVFICSSGPMGSTLAGGMVEKLGFLNLPLRKTGLSSYLSGELGLDSTVFQRVISRQVFLGSKPSFQGGVSVIDKNRSENFKSLTDFSRVKDDLSRFNERGFDSLADLYSEGRKIYARSVTYKEIDPTSNLHVEYPVDFHRYPWKDLEKGINQTFLNYTLVKMRRPFQGWLNSAVSHFFYRSPLKATRSCASFSISRRAAAYDSYNRAMDRLPGVDWDFDELFDEEIEARLAFISNEFGLSPFAHGTIFQPHEGSLLFDLYGKLTPASVALRKFDDNVDFIPAKLQVGLDEFRKKRHAMASHQRIAVTISARVQVFMSFIFYFLQRRSRLA